MPIHTKVNKKTKVTKGQFLLSEWKFSKQGATPSQATPKRKKKTSTSASEAETSPLEKPARKKVHRPKDQNNSNSDSDYEDIEEETVANSGAKMTSLEDIKKSLENLATKNDICSLKNDFKIVMEKLTTRMDHLESRCFEAEKAVDGAIAQCARLEKENTVLKDELNSHRQHIKKLSADQNDREQYDRRWNLRVYNAKESGGETAEECTRATCEIFTQLIGVRTTEADLEACHRVGPPRQDKPRPIIARFVNRKLRDRVLTDRKKLKSKGVSVDEDLTSANFKLAKEVYKHSASLSSWTSNGKVLCKLKNGKTVRVPFGSDVDALLCREMQGKE